MFNCHVTLTTAITTAATAFRFWLGHFFTFNPAEANSEKDNLRILLEQVFLQATGPFYHQPVLELGHVHWPTLWPGFI